MKALKILAAIILSIVLITAQMSAAAVKAIIDSMTAEAISGAITDTGSMSARTDCLTEKAPVLIAKGILFETYTDFELTDEDIKAIGGAFEKGDIKAALSKLISDNADRLGVDPAKAGKIAAAILKTEAAADFIGKYSSGLISSVLYGTDTPVIGSQEVSELINAVVKELPDDIRSDIDTDKVHSYIDDNAQSISDKINSAAEDTKNITERADSHVRMDPETAKALRLFLSFRMFIFLTAISVILGFGLILLFIKSKAGFLIWGILSAIGSLPFLLTKRASAYVLAKLPDYDATAILLKPLAAKFQEYGLYMLCFAAVLAVLFVLMRIKVKHINK